MNTGIEIKHYLDDNGILQVWLSKKTKIPNVKLNLALNGKRNMSIVEYELICGALGVGVDKFIRPKLSQDNVDETI